MLDLQTQNEVQSLLPFLTAHEHDEIAQLIATMERRPHSYQARGTCLELYQNRGPEVIISGSAGTGKSRSCLEKLNDAAWDYPGMRGLIIRKTRESLTESGLHTFEHFVLEDGDRIHQNVQRRMRQAYRYPNGSEIIIGGMNKAERIMSTEYDLIFVQEAIELTEDDWELLTTRLRNSKMPYQQIMGDTNPAQPTHWLKQRCNQGRTALLESRHEDNPVLWDIIAGVWTKRGLDYIDRLDNLTGVRKQRLRYGKWVQAEGIVYEDWDPTIHLIDRFDIPDDWRRIRAIDFGYVHPFVCQWWAIDGDGRMYLYREIYHTQRTVRVHAMQINKLSQGESIETTICDHDAEDRATLRENGISSVAALKGVSPGIQAVQERLKIAGDDRPRVFIMRDSLVELDQSLIEAKHPYRSEQEWDGYVWMPNKEAPIKDQDDGLDTLRYSVMYVDHPQPRKARSYQWR